MFRFKELGEVFCNLLHKLFVHNTKMLHSVQVANSVIARVIVQKIPHFLNYLTSHGRKATFFWRTRTSELRKKEKVYGRKNIQSIISFKACTAHT